MFEIAFAALTILVVILIWRNREASMLFAASSDDWFLHVASNATAKVVTINFYPVVAFRIASGYCEPITTRPQVTAPLWRAGHAADSELVTSKSEEYGRWFRHGFRYDSFGSTCWSGLHLHYMVWLYREAGYHVSAINAPPAYAQYFQTNAEA